ncbi:MAG: class I SAM-dependent methyltransferase [Anaerolineae bacterium]|nr:class I SAM-dependent methyltransferase [Anaerolineae bacterium]
MDTKQVDYDRIAAGYDRRFVMGDTQGVAEALSALAQGLSARRILEAGCGTGRWLVALRPITRRVNGLDLSAGMLGRARQREDLRRLVRGRASRLPFSTAQFDLVYCVNALHHFQSPRGFVHEARRLLRPGGALAVATMDPRLLRERWYVYEYFRGTYETDVARFPSWGTILDWMAGAGFERIQWQPVEQVVDEKAGRAVLDDYFLEKDACSQLSLLSDEEYAAGLRRIEAAVAGAEARGETATFAVDLFFAMVIGWAG